MRKHIYLSAIFLFVIHHLIGAVNQERVLVIGGKLPSETEWTYAAKGGRKSKNYIYVGSNQLDEVGWYKLNCEEHSHEVEKGKPISAIVLGLG
ncbi:MAG: SUMF1/EgtB/PvdO family nonheme iron enzyme [Mariniphaga sp.]